MQVDRAHGAAWREQGAELLAVPQGAGTALPSPARGPPAMGSTLQAGWVLSALRHGAGFWFG